MACLVPFALFWTVVSAASAEQPVPPLLLGTNPPSTAEAPASSITPVVLGESEPTVIEERAPLAVRPFRTAGGSTAGNVTEHPDYIIEIFAGEECAAPAIGRAKAGTFDAEGIPVSVAVDQKSTFSAWQVDPATPSAPSSCSGPLYYWEGNVPSEAGSGGNGEGGGSSGGEGGVNSGGQGGGATGGSSGGGTAAPPTKPQAPRIHTDPGGVANNTAPLIVGSTQAAESVLVYTSEGCKGTPVASGPASQLQSGFQVQVAPNATTTFSVAAIVGQYSACSDPVAYIEDSTAPRTRITMAPGVKTRKRKVAFRFKDITDDPPGTTFACKVDKKKWKTCASPFHLKRLKYGHHLVKIRATDLAGNRERKPVKRRFIVIHR